MTRKKAPNPKPSKAIPVRSSDDPAERHRNFAKAMIAPEVATFRVFSATEQPGLKDQLDTPAMIRVLKDLGEAVTKGDMTHPEQMLMGQASALQILFGRLTERAMEQSHLPNMEAFMKLALRAQSQCRATLETLATIKNPPMIYAKQINQTTGPQQINNAVVPPSQARPIENTPNKLLEADNGKWLDAGTTGTTSGVDSEMAPVGAVDGAAD